MTFGEIAWLLVIGVIATIVGGIVVKNWPGYWVRICDRWYYLKRFLRNAFMTEKRRKKEMEEKENQRRQDMQDSDNPDIWKKF